MAHHAWARLCGAGRAACAGPGRAVTGGVHWGVRSVCAGGVRARPRRGRVSAGGHLGARCCCAGGLRSRCARRSGGLRPSSRRHARMLAGGVEGAGVQSAGCVLRHVMKAVRWCSYLSALDATDSRPRRRRIRTPPAQQQRAPRCPSTAPGKPAPAHAAAPAACARPAPHSPAPKEHGTPDAMLRVSLFVTGRHGNCGRKIFVTGVTHIAEH